MKGIEGETGLCLSHSLEGLSMGVVSDSHFPTGKVDLLLSGGAEAEDLP